MQREAGDGVLTPELERAAKVIAAGGNRKKAAEVAGVSERWLYYQLRRNKALRDCISNLQELEATRVQRYLIGKAAVASAVLVAIVQGRVQAGPTRMEAIKTLLSYALGKPGQGSVAIEAHTDEEGQTIRVVVGHPPKA